MIVSRNEWRIKMGMIQTAVKLLREEDNAVLSAEPNKRPPARIYTSMFGPVSRVAMEWTFSSMSEKDANSEAWRMTGRVPAFQDKFAEVNDRNLSNDIYNLYSSHAVEDSKNAIAVRSIRKPIAGTRKWVEYMEHLDKWVVKTGKYTARVMHPIYGVNHGVVIEIEYASLMDYQTQTKEWHDQPDTKLFWKIFNELTLPEGSSTVWHLMP